MVRTASEIETNIVAVERVKEYSSIEQEVTHVCVLTLLRVANPVTCKQIMLQCVELFLGMCCGFVES